MPEPLLTRKQYIWLGLITLLVIVLIILRLYLTTWVLNYVNQTLNNIDGYQGSVGSIDIDLYRGAYTIYDLKLYKKSGHIPVPFIDIARSDLSIQWRALFHGRIVSNIDLNKPIINFAVNKSAEQNGSNVDWNKPIHDLMPIDINLVTFKNGSLTYQDFSSAPPINIYIHDMTGAVKNLRNVIDRQKPLPSSLQIIGDSIGGGTLDIQGRMNILKPVPDLDLDIKLENVNLPALNNYIRNYAFIDVKTGNLSIYSELTIKDNQVSGYVKPIARHIKIINLRKDKNPIKLVWKSIVSGLVTIFSNQHKDQFATKVPLSGSFDHIETGFWSTIGGIFRNAFVQAFHKGLDHNAGFKKS